MTNSKTFSTSNPVHFQFQESSQLKRLWTVLHFCSPIHPERNKITFQKRVVILPEAR